MKGKGFAIATPKKHPQIKIKYMKEIKERKYWALCAPDGEIQFALIGKTKQNVKAFTDYLALWGIGRKYDELIQMGYKLNRITLSASLTTKTK